MKSKQGIERIIFLLRWCWLCCGLVMALASSCGAAEDQPPIALPHTRHFVLAHSYPTDRKLFETAWARSLALVDHSENQSARWPPSFEVSIPIAYKAAHDHHRVICIPFDDDHFFAVVQFQDPTKLSLALYLRFPARTALPNFTRLERLLEQLPYCVQPAKADQDYPLQRDGTLNPQVFMRDFFPAIVAVD